MYIQVIYSASEKLEQIAIMNYFGLLLLFHVASSGKTMLHVVSFSVTAQYSDSFIFKSKVGLRGVCRFKTETLQFTYYL